ncbi:hypothetical protein TNCV_730621 [Trichonephila clavipes]|nr:hypothetical protein TNCV_730621 [Trichonephila clavipes]
MSRKRSKMECFDYPTCERPMEKKRAFFGCGRRGKLRVSSFHLSGRRWNDLKRELPLGFFLEEQFQESGPMAPFREEQRGRTKNKYVAETTFQTDSCLMRQSTFLKLPRVFPFLADKRRLHIPPDPPSIIPNRPLHVLLKRGPNGRGHTISPEGAFPPSLQPFPSLNLFAVLPRSCFKRLRQISFAQLTGARGGGRHSSQTIIKRRFVPSRGLFSRSVPALTTSRRAMGFCRERVTLSRLKTGRGLRRLITPFSRSSSPPSFLGIC